MSDHYESQRGTVVSVLGTAYNMETGEDMVLYYPLTHPERYYVRSRRNFFKRYKKQRGTDNEKFKEIADKLRSIESCSKSGLLHQAADVLEEMSRELQAEMYRHDRLQDFEVAEAEQLRQMTIERNMLARKLEELERESFRWEWHYDLPTEDNRDTLILIASGRGANMVLKEAMVIGCYMGSGKWFLEDYQEIDDATVKCWTTAPEVE